MQSAPSDRPRIFLSFSATDAVPAKQLELSLAAAGAVIYPGLDSELVPGNDVHEATRQAMEKSEWVVVVLTPAAIASQWVRAEVALASEYANRQSLRGIVLFVTQPYDPASLPPLWATLERIDATHDIGAGLATLLARLGLRAPAAPTQDLVTGWDGTLRDAAAPDMADMSPPHDTDEETTTAAPAPGPTWDADEIVRGWDDTPTMQAPREEEAQAAETASPPLEAVRGGTPPPHPLPEWNDDIRVAGVLHPPAPSVPPAPAPRPAQQPTPPPSYPPAPPQQSEREGAAPGGFPPPPYTPPPLGANVPDGAPAPGFGAPPAGYPGYPAYPPAGYPGYAPVPSYPQAPNAPAPSYPPYPPAPGYAPPPGYDAPPNPMAPAPQGGYGYPGPFAPWPQTPAAPVATAEQVTFTAYHLKEIAPLVWEPLYVYIALDTPQA
ncbi:MAG: toll/interleukin-1 receptor domain-containing protein, partial [Ktedonobacterales bacterium]